jgi:hypothetical protein
MQGNGRALQFQKVFIGNAWTLTAEGLFPYTNYRFMVAAVNAVGVGKYSTAAMFRTKNPGGVCPGGTQCFDNGLCNSSLVCMPTVLFIQIWNLFFIKNLGLKYSGVHMLAQL